MKKQKKKTKRKNKTKKHDKRQRFMTKQMIIVEKIKNERRSSSGIVSFFIGNINFHAR